MTTIGLLRHGEVEGGNCFRGSTDDPLTDIGLNQMRIATRGKHQWDRVISSPLKRCVSFAREYSLQHSIPLAFDERLKELHFGLWEGRTSAEIMNEDPEALSQFWSDPDRYPPPEGESFLVFQARVLEACNSIKNDYNKQRTLIVTHGGVIRTLLCHLQQRPVSELMNIDVKLGSLTVLCSSLNAPELVNSRLER